MKSLTAVIAAFFDNRNSRTNFITLLRLLAVLGALVVIYSLLFHHLMEREGQSHSWVTGFYWTLTVMTTLGFGDVTFTGDLGRVFSIVVLVTGVMFMLVILPFTFIQFFYAPWMQAQASARAPRRLPKETAGHVILTNHDPITLALIPLLDKYGHPYVILNPTVTQAIELYEQGLCVAVGDLDDPETYQRMQLQSAALLVATRSDVINTNITFTARELAPEVPIIASASSRSARDVLELAGATLVLRLEETMGQTLARRVIGNDSAAHIIGQASGLSIAEAHASNTELEGRTLAESGIRQRTGASVIGIWERGRLVTSDPSTRIQKQSVLVLAGTEEQLAKYNTEFSHSCSTERSHILIIGGGRVGRITSAALRTAGFQPVIIEKLAERVADHPEAVIGDATHIETLRAARAREADTIIITSHDDDLNISLTIFFRRMRATFQIISRCTLDRNVQTLHRAGADLVLSSASMGANMIFNQLRKSDNLLLAEGVALFPVEVPAAMAGRRIADCAVRAETGCTIIAIEDQGKKMVNPDPGYILPEHGRMLLIGTLEAEEAFLRKFRPDLAPSGLREGWRKLRPHRS
jgi:voltage-gated potassium channel